MAAAMSARGGGTSPRLLVAARMAMPSPISSPMLARRRWVAWARPAASAGVSQKRLRAAKQQEEGDEGELGEESNPIGRGEKLADPAELQHRQSRARGDQQSDGGNRDGREAPQQSERRLRRPPADRLPERPERAEPEGGHEHMDGEHGRRQPERPGGERMAGEREAAQRDEAGGQRQQRQPSSGAFEGDDEER